MLDDFDYKMCRQGKKILTITSKHPAWYRTTPESMITFTTNKSSRQKQLTKGHKLVQSFFCKAGPCYRAPQGNQQPIKMIQTNDKTKKRKQIHI